MIIIWGSKLFGKTDEVPELFHVATKFGHLWYIPLIPLGSHLVLEESDEGWRGLELPMSGKSVRLATFRGRFWRARVHCGRPPDRTIAERLDSNNIGCKNLKAVCRTSC